MSTKCELETYTRNPIIKSITSVLLAIFVAVADNVNKRILCIMGVGKWLNYDAQIDGVKSCTPQELALFVNISFTS